METEATTRTRESGAERLTRAGALRLLGSLPSEGPGTKSAAWAAGRGWRYAVVHSSAVKFSATAAWDGGGSYIAEVEMFPGAAAACCGDGTYAWQAPRTRTTDLRRIAGAMSVHADACYQLSMRGRGLASSMERLLDRYATCDIMSIGRNVVCGGQGSLDEAFACAVLMEGGLPWDCGAAAGTGVERMFGADVPATYGRACVTGLYSLSPAGLWEPRGGFIGCPPYMGNWEMRLEGYAAREAGRTLAAQQTDWFGGIPTVAAELNPRAATVSADGGELRFGRPA